MKLEILFQEAQLFNKLTYMIRNSATSLRQQKSNINEILHFRQHIPHIFHAKDSMLCAATAPCN
jgi:hypothetical protein